MRCNKPLRLTFENKSEFVGKQIKGTQSCKVKKH